MPVQESIDLAIKDIFKECQNGQQIHFKLIKKLRKIYDENPFEKFSNCFGNLLHFPLVVSERAAAVERTINFVAKFASSFEGINNDQHSFDERDKNTNLFVVWLFKFVLKLHDIDNSTVRFRVCQLINKLLNDLNENAQIDDDVYDAILDNILRRLSDKTPLVRVQAALALSRLQDPKDKECPVINAYIFHLGNDPNADVRKAILSCIAASPTTLPCILERCRDFKDSVRKVAYSFLATKVHIKSLTIRQRIQLLHEGLKDRSVGVRKVVELSLVKNWLNMCDDNILKLLKCLDVENSSDTVALVLETIFHQYKSLSELASSFTLLNESKVLDANDISCEKAIFWLNICKYLKNSPDPKAESIFENLMPELIFFLKYLDDYLHDIPNEEDVEKCLQHDFVSQQLLELASVYDYTDIVGRKLMESNIRALLLSLNVNLTLIKPLISRFCDVTTIDNRISHLAEIISEIREPLTIVEKGMSEADIREIDLKLAKFSIEIYSLEDELQTCIKNEDFQKAQEIKDKMSELKENKSKLNLEKKEPSSEEVRIEKNDPDTLQKCLTIVCELLQQSKLLSLNPTLQSIFDTLILPGIQNEDPLVRNLAVRGLGLSCLLSKNIALQHFVLFIQISQVDQESICVTALKAIFDILIMYGMDSFCDGSPSFGDSPSNESDEVFSDSSFSDLPSSDKSSNETAKHVTTILTSLLDSELSEVSTVAAEGLGKLLLLGRIYSPRLLSRLIILWYNPITEDNKYLRHFLGAFLPAFAALSRKNHECIEEAFIPTLKTLYDAPVSSPLAEIDSLNVAKFMLTLTIDPPQIKDNVNSNVHDCLVIKISNEILKDPNSYSVRLLVKILGYLNISCGNANLLQEILVLTEQILVSVRDKLCEKPLVKFKDKLEDSLAKLNQHENAELEKSNDTKIVESIEKMVVSEKTSIKRKLDLSHCGILPKIMPFKLSFSYSTSELSDPPIMASPSSNTYFHDSKKQATLSSHSLEQSISYTSQDDFILETDFDSNSGDQTDEENFDDFLPPSPQHLPGRKFPKYKKK